MNDSLFLIPKAGRLVRDPVTSKPLAPEGEAKPKTGYWLRRIMDGDVTEGTAPAHVPVPVPKTKSTSKE